MLEVQLDVQPEVQLEAQQPPPNMQNISRYVRQIVTLGEAANARLRSASIAIIGLGGIGSNSATLCAQIGVKALKLVDRDVVEASNLGRQILYTRNDVGKFKALIAAKRLKLLNPDLEIKAFNEQLSKRDCPRILSGVDLILDGTDNYETRAMINEFCVNNDKRWIYAGALGSKAMMTTILPKKTPCFACWAPAPKRARSCAEAGILPTTTSFIAAQQVHEAINLLCFNKPQYAGKLLYVDLSKGLFESLPLKKKAKCSVCGCL